LRAGTLAVLSAVFFFEKRDSRAIRIRIELIVNSGCWRGVVCAGNGVVVGQRGSLAGHKMRPPLLTTNKVIT